MTSKRLCLGVAALGALLWLSASGCRREVGPPAPLPVTDIAAEFDRAFKSAKPNVKALAAEITTSLSRSNYPAAYEQVQVLCAAPEATEDQKALAARALLTITALLQSAQSAGDTKAAEVLSIQKRFR